MKCPKCKGNTNRDCKVCYGYGRVCPVCGSEVSMTTRCLNSPSWCKNGHKWHYEKDEFGNKYAVVDSIFHKNPFFKTI